MKHFPIVFVCALVMIACHKNNSLLSANNASRLMAISSDSLGGLKFSYTMNAITGISSDRDLVPYGNYSGAASKDLDSIQYDTTNSVHYVTLAEHRDTFQDVMTYTLTSLKLPLSIDYKYTSGGAEHYSNIAKFIYFPGTDLLDSVIFNSGLYGTVVFKVNYIGKNITGIVESNKSGLISTFTFTYTNVPNIFRQTDSLLYIYSYPETALYAQPMVVAAFFAETFSESTFNNIKTNDIPLGWAQGTFTANMLYSLNADGKITEERFDDNSFFEGLAGKKYYYK